MDWSSPNTVKTMNEKRRAFLLPEEYGNVRFLTLSCSSVCKQNNGFMACIERQSPGIMVWSLWSARQMPLRSVLRPDSVWEFDFVQHLN